MEKCKKKERCYEILEKIIYIADQSNLYNSVREYLYGKYQMTYEPISKVQDVSQIFEHTYVLYIIEMKSFSPNSANLIHKIRLKSINPILFISRTNLEVKQKQEEIHAFESGADEYFGSPLKIEKVIIRLKALIRMQNRIRKKMNIWYFDKLQIAPGYRKIFREGEEIVLTKIEFDIISFLAQQNERVVTYKELYEVVWNSEYLQDDANIMAHVHRLRRKIEKDIKNPQYIQNVYGVGYRFGKYET